jgi:large subunit ribosomal protein L24
MAARIRKGDRVVVLTGKDKGKSGDVVRIIPDKNRAIVRGVNMVRRHQRQSAGEQGGIIAKEASIHLSNIAIADRDADDKPTRIGFRFQDDGRKVRYAKRSGGVIDG